MTTLLRQVLQHFEQAEGQDGPQRARSLPQLARELGIERDTLQNLIDHWVRKGKLREVSAPACGHCGSASGCPFVVALPRCYELAHAESEPSEAAEPPPCTCASCHG